MSHIDSQHIHAYVNRGLDLRVSVVTTQAHSDFTAITFRIGSVVTKSSLTATDTSAGFDVDLTLTAADLNISAGDRRWELVATFGGQVRTLAEGWFTLTKEPTP